MRNFFKRILSVTAAAALLFCSPPQNNAFLQHASFSPVLTASAAETSGKCGDNVRWAYDEATNTLTLSGTGPMYDFEPIFEPLVPIPWSGFSTNIKKIVIGGGITTIGNKAFLDCRSVTEIYIPDGVTRIGCSSFTFCYALASVRFPQSLTFVSDKLGHHIQNSLKSVK